MKTTISRLAPILLLLWLLPACAELPGFPATSQETVSAEESLFQSAESSYRRQRYTEAWQFYHSYLQRYPKGRLASKASLREAELLGQQGNWQGSLAAFQAILAGQTEPSVALKARYGIGRAYFKMGDYQQAGQILDSLTAGDLPRSLWFSTQALLAEIALKQGNVPQAFARLRLAARDVASGDQEWYEDLKHRVVEAASPADLENLANVYRDAPLSPALVLRLARLSQQSGQSGEGQKWLKVLQERYPGTPEAAAAERQFGGGAAGGKITLGCLLPLSGEMSNVGFRVQRGMELAARQVPVELIFKDTQNSADSAAQLVQELTQNQRLSAIIGPLTSGVAQAAARAAQGAGVPLVALSQKADLTQTGNLIFQAFLTPRQQVRALVQRAIGMGLRQFTILYPDSAYGRTFLQAFQAELSGQGIDLAAQEPYTPGTQDFSQSLSNLQTALQVQAPEGSGAQALFIPDDAAVVAAVITQRASLSLGQVQVLGTNLLHDPRVAPEQLTALEGVMFPDAFFTGDTNPAVQGFVAAYRQQYGETPDYLAAQGYVVIRLTGQLSQSGGPLGRAELPQKLMTMRGGPDLPWFKGFNPQREEEAALYLLTIRAGQIQMVSPSQ